uniref:Thyroglobulin type-1 domain-containing protein n=1 Tax=Pectinophora gossypiella TaxID=13191 RepID=A0A1E1WTB8_PECGO
MDGLKSILLVYLLFYLRCVCGSTILCESGFCRTYRFETGCAVTASECSINNATHTGLSMLSPTVCNCCEFCLPFYGEDQHCSRGGPGMGTNVGRCGPGLSCVASDDGFSYCRRMESECHSAQDDYEARYEAGDVGVLESPPICDGKGSYAHFDCVPTQTCYCQSDEGDRIFGEVLNLGAVTTQNMHCGCSKMHEKIEKNIASGLRFPVVGPRCTSDGNFNPIQCLNRTCYCVDKITGRIDGDHSINLDYEPIKALSCYDATLDLFPSQSQGEAPYNYTTPCLEDLREKIEFILKSEEDGYNVDLFNNLAGCLPDGTYSRIRTTRSGSRICVDETRHQLGDYEALPGTQQFEDMDCKCAQTTAIMKALNERPVCCNNGNFRTIQCRRGLCRCVDSDGKQYGRESDTVTSLSCYKPDWRNLNSTDCYAR